MQIMAIMQDLGEYLISKEDTIIHNTLRHGAIDGLGIHKIIDTEYPPNSHQFRGIVIPFDDLETYVSKQETFIVGPGISSSAAVYHAVKQILLPNTYDSNIINNNPACIVLVYDPSQLERDILEEYRPKFRFKGNPKDARLAIFHWFLKTI
jgi:hypothetical protein